MALLTGMGRDGTAGLLALRRAGGTVLAQDEAVSLEDMGARIAASWTEPAC